MFRCNAFWSRFYIQWFGEFDTIPPFRVRDFAFRQTDSPFQPRALRRAGARKRHFHLPAHCSCTEKLIAFEFRLLPLAFLRSGDF
jgi:hypothetical protein